MKRARPLLAALLVVAACSRAFYCETDHPGGYCEACIAAAHDASQDYCDPPGRSELARRLRGKAWRW